MPVHDCTEVVENCTEVPENGTKVSKNGTMVVGNDTSAKKGWIGAHRGGTRGRSSASKLNRHAPSPTLGESAWASSRARSSSGPRLAAE
jgi:hypothetical protein